MDDEGALDDAKVLERMRATLGIPDFAPKIHLISRWTMEVSLPTNSNPDAFFWSGTPRIVIRPPVDWD
jgi:hypothetical protein